ncbi:MAG: PAS domain-containing protein, partial [Oscillospiraceae bacterium]
MQIDTKYVLDILESIQGGVILCKYDMTAKSAQIIYINRGWAAITGYTLEQLVAEKNGNPQALILPEDRTAADADYA